MQDPARRAGGGRRPADPAAPEPDLLIGVEHGDDAAVVQISGDRAVVATADFFTPVVDDAYTFGQIAAANALSDVYAVGGEPLVALNLLGWPREQLSAELAARGAPRRPGRRQRRPAASSRAGTASTTRSPSTAWRSPAWPTRPRCCASTPAEPGLPLSLTKPIGSGVLNARHKATGEVFPAAIEVMTTLNAAASRAALASGLRCATDVTGFGLLGHLFKLARASGVTAVLDSAAVPLIDGARAAAQAGYIPGGSRRNLDWVAPHADFGRVPDELLLLLADAQTSGGLLLAGEIPGARVIGELIPRSGPALIVR